MPLSTIRIEDEVFVSEGTVGVGAVRRVAPRELTIYIEGYGDIEIGPENIAAAHGCKVILMPETLPGAVQAHLKHVHDGEFRRPSDR